MHQHCFARLQVGFHIEIDKGRQVDLRQPRRRVKIPTRRDRHQHRLGDGHLFGIAATGQQRTDPVAHLPALNIGAGLGNDAGHFQPDNIGRPWRWRIVTGPLHEISAIERGGMNINQHFICAKGRVGAFTPNEGTIGVLGINVDGFHQLSFQFRRLRDCGTVSLNLFISQSLLHASRQHTLVSERIRQQRHAFGDFRRGVVAKAQADEILAGSAVG